VLTNWAGNITYAAQRVHRPTSVPEVQRVVAGSRRVRALGTRHSFNRLADCTGDLVVLDGLPPTLDIDAEQATVRLSAGLRYGDIGARLHAAGVALPNLGSLPHISVVGACATATHGSGDSNGVLSTAVRSLDLVTATGDLVTIGRDAPDFPGVVVGLGALGVVTSVTLDVLPAYDIAQHVYDDMPLGWLVEHLDEVFASGYSVSAFTLWRSSGTCQVWRKQRVEAVDAPPRQWLGAVLADGPRHPVPGMPTQNCTPQQGLAGPWHERLPHFRLEHTPSAGEELQSEFLVGRDVAVEALRAVAGIAERVAPVVQTSEVRTVGADELWLSPCYRRDSVAIHFTWVKDPAAVTPVVAAVEEALAPFDARPHWGKLFGSAADDLARTYPRLPDFARLLDHYDPHGKLRNEFIERCVTG
jgi:xylitol oxidase